MCLFLCQYHSILITKALLYSLEQGCVISPPLFFFLKIVLAIQGLLWFYIKFRIARSISVKSAIGIFI